ncbi:sulfite exporter TauE/SafE family protein [Aestuariivita boseongensis]|uniref:sulfite exporter TauE/SafE family protein n=1 Tax=Aestuariivita boseongensis TaxID=1470562 RepID=UPI000681B0B2|nr:sulfite exporter TauE/SafE family protein [Aestuariivita boseongensis]
MPEVLTQALALPGLGWLIAAALVAGIVRGFAGFGTAMVYLPVAGAYLDPFAALTTVIIMDLIGPLPGVPRALRERHPGDLGRLVSGLVIGLPLGVLTLSLISPDMFRYSVSFIALMLLALLITGFRYHGEMTPRLITGTGFLGGYLGGTAGLPGPPVIMLYMASSHPAPVVRATNTLYLLIFDFFLLGTFLVLGRLDFGFVGLGFVVMVPYLIGNVIGGALFRAEYEKLYRWVAYAIIAASALMGLPFWEG